MALKREYVEKAAADNGFDLVGFAEALPLMLEARRLSDWIETGLHGGMAYMERNREKRADVRTILPGAKSVISLGLNYYIDEPPESIENGGIVSRYAWGKDYHYIMWDKLEKLIALFKKADSGFEGIGYVDTGPVMDKVWAVRAGLGWMGKHSNIINKQYGSWFFIATIICNSEFDYDSPVPDGCGKCTICIDACPTNAIYEARVIDARKCISYNTIELKDEIDTALKGQFEGYLFGCDICQAVCPYNKKKKASSTNEKDFFSLPLTKTLGFDEIEAMSNSEFKKRFSQSPIARARLKGLRRNAAFVKPVR